MITFRKVEEEEELDAMQSLAIVYWTPSNCPQGNSQNLYMIMRLMQSGGTLRMLLCAVISGYWIISIQFVQSLD